MVAAFTAEKDGTTAGCENVRDPMQETPVEMLEVGFLPEPDAEGRIADNICAVDSYDIRGRTPG